MLMSQSKDPSVMTLTPSPLKREILVLMWGLVAKLLTILTHKEAIEF